ncbi:MAG: hypothetical protein LBL36_07470 [Clostridiales Family XIII bacterium]|nr:hypothetical protein [Clostridiales Family XIII bacterium]
MNKVMVFIDFENFNIAKMNYYRKLHGSELDMSKTPKVDFVCLARELAGLLSDGHKLIKTFLFAPKPDDFLMQDEKRKKAYEWISSHRNMDYLTIIEGTHSARPAPG